LDLIETEAEMDEATEKAIRVKNMYRDEWLQIRDVVAAGVGIENGRPAVIISVEKRVSAVRRQIPEQIDGVPVIIRQTGGVKAL
jgi:hypothetical protein